MDLQGLVGDKINWEKPVFTLDVNQVALKEPSTWSSELEGLAQLEWNYFGTQQVEMCVTPESPFEITKGVDQSQMGWNAYNRFQKSLLFKSRPDGVRLNLSQQDANSLWGEVRQILWPTVTDQLLSITQRSDVSQLYFHIIASGAIANSAFITIDHNFAANANTIQKNLGVTVLNPSQAWEEYRPKFSLQEPSASDMQLMWDNQQNSLARLRQEAGRHA